MIFVLSSQNKSIKLNAFKIPKYSKGKQYIISILLVISVSITCFVFSDVIGNKVVALLLLVIVSLLAMLFDIMPVLIAALLSALIWNFFFIPPLYTFHINNAEDVLMFFMYLAIALVNASLSYQIRQTEKKARDKEEKDNTIKLYNTLINCLSHELRTPISTIMGSVETLMEHYKTLPPETQHEILGEINTATVRLNRQVENLLNMNRLETGMLKLHLNWCDVTDLIYSVIQKIPEEYKTHKISVIYSEEAPLCKLDSGLMEQVIQNLLYNAILYTPINSEINIIFEIQQENCIIKVEDNGNGIPANELEQIFEKFYRIPHSRTGGTGLGLSIVKGFVNAHNGTIQVENLKKGCQFIISIPCELSYINQLKNE